MKQLIEKNIDESILSSTNTGRKATTEQFLKDNKIYTIKNNEELVDTAGDVHCRTFTSTWGNDYEEIDFDIYVDDAFRIEGAKKVKELTLPITATNIFINDCPNLQTIHVKEGSRCKSVEITGCKSLTYMDELKNMDAKSIILSDTGIESCNIIHPNVEKVVFEDCANMKDAEGEFGNNTKIEFDSCPIKNIEISGGKELSIKQSPRMTQCKFTNKSLKDIKIYKCSALTSLSIDGTKLETLVVSTCKKLIQLSCPDCAVSLSLVDLPNFETLENDKISGTAVFRNIKTKPVIKAKKIIES